MKHAARHRLTIRPRSTRIAAVAAAVSVASATLFVGVAAAASNDVAQSDSSAFTATKSVSRVNLINGADVTADSRKFSVSVDTTTNLRDRQGINIAWSGAHPTGGVVFNVNSAHAADQEYPVVVLQCRGVDSTAVAASQRVSPQTCFTQSPSTRYQYPFRGQFPAYRLDRYATAADRKRVVGAPSPLPSTCLQGPGAERWVPFVSADKTVYYGGYNGCGGLAPEQSILDNTLSPSNETYGTTDSDGNGSARFIVQDEEDNASLGCSATVRCSLVVIPIEGISCDAAALSLPAEDRPTKSNLAAAQRECTQTGFYRPGQPNGSQSGDDSNSEVAVNGETWWSASNWRNRISVPLSFAVSSSACELFGGTHAPPTDIFGSEYMLQATQQWSPAFCTNPKLFRLQHTQVSEVQAKNLLATGVTGGKYLGVKAAFQAAPPDPKFSNPIVQAPTAVSGFAIGYVMDDASGHPFTGLKLNARLLAKLLSMSYPVLPAIESDWATNDKWAKYKDASTNPLDMSVDPEFVALNPGMKNQFINQLEASAAVAVMSSDSDVMSALTSYINEDPEARAFLDGDADPWGMVVNPNYKGIKLPLTSWPLLDTYLNTLGNSCLADAPQPYLPLVAGQVSDPAQITFNMQLGISSAQTNCVITGGVDAPGSRRLAGAGAQQPSKRFLLGLVSLADADRYSIPTAALQTQKDASAPEGKFTDATGRHFASPAITSLKAAAKLMQPDDAAGTWPVPYHKLRTDPAGQDAYPGTLLLSTDVPTAGLEQADAVNYAKFLNYVAGPGQVAGDQNGDLAGGYLGITRSNGLGAMHDYTVAAAAAVAQQHGFVPKPSAPVIQTVPTSSAPTEASSSASSSASRSTPSSTRTSTTPASANGSPPMTTVNTGPLGGGGVTSAVSSSAPGSGKPSSSTGSDASPTSSSVVSSGSAAPVATALTMPTKPGWSAHVLAALAVLALVSGALATWTSGIGRRAQ